MGLSPAIRLPIFETAATHRRIQESSAIIADLPPGNYTAIVRGVNATTGVALVEADDLAIGTNSILENISTRAFVQTGDNVMIGGFIIGGTQSKRVIVRAIGPSLPTSIWGSKYTG